MYLNFRTNLQVGYFRCFNSHVFTKHDVFTEHEDDVTPITNSGEVTEKVEKRSVKKGHNYSVFNCVIQAKLMTKTRRRGRGDMGVISNSDMHILNGNRGNFLDALF